MEPVVYDFAINERGTCADLLRGRRRADAARLLRADRAGAAAAGPPRALAAAPRRAGPVRRRLPHAARAARHGADAVRRHAAARQGAKPAAEQTLAALLDAERLRPRAARADPRRPAQTAASAWRRTACRPAPIIEDVQAERCRRLPRSHVGRRSLRERGLDGAEERRGRRRHAGGRRRQPLDAGRGRGQGAASVLQARRPAPHLPRDAPGQEPARSPSEPARRSRTSSPPATSRTSRSRSSSTAQKQLRLRRAAVSSRRAARSACA